MRSFVFLSLLLCVAMPSVVRAGETTFVVGFAAGGTSSTAARAMLEPFARVSGQRLVIEYKPGAGGLLAARYVAAQGPESNTLLVMSSNSSLRVPTNLGLVPVAIVARYDYVIVAGRQFKGTLASYLAQAKTDPALQTMATAGAGSIAHLSTARLFRAHGVGLVHIPLSGSAPAITAVLGGHVALAAVPYPDFVSFEGSLSIVARSGSEIEERGWIGVYAPPNTPRERVAQLAVWLESASQESAPILSKLGFTAEFGLAQELVQRHEADRRVLMPELEREGVHF